MIFPATAASEVLYDEAGRVRGIATNDIGIGKNGEKKDAYAQGMELHAKLTLFGEVYSSACVRVRACEVRLCACK